MVLGGMTEVVRCTCDQSTAVIFCALASRTVLHTVVAIFWWIATTPDHRYTQWAIPSLQPDCTP
jgi:hypothetical protein